MTNNISHPLCSLEHIIVIIVDGFQFTASAFYGVTELLFTRNMTSTCKAQILQFKKPYITSSTSGLTLLNKIIIFTSHRATCFLFRYHSA